MEEGWLDTSERRFHFTLSRLGVDIEAINPDRAQFQVQLEGNQNLGFSAQFGYFHIIITDVTIYNRLENPYKSNCTYGEGDLNVFPGPYTREKCSRTMELKQLLLKCNAVPDHMQKYVRPHFKRRWKYIHDVIGRQNQTDYLTLSCIEEFFRSSG